MGWRRPRHAALQVLVSLVGALLAAGLTLAPGLGASAAGGAAQPGAAQPQLPVLSVFVRQGCPHCDRAKAFLPELQRRHPELEVRLRWVDADAGARQELLVLSRQAGVQAPGVPSFAFGEELLVGFDSPAGRGQDLLSLVERRSAVAGDVRAGPLGTLSAGRLGLPLFTFTLGLLDGFNPCAMWVLLFLLALMVHWRDRRRMALVAGTFVLVSGAVYFLFMAAWLNVFLVLGLSTPLRLVLAVLALAVGLVNLREAAGAQASYTFAIPDSAKPGLYVRMRRVIQSRSLLPALAGATVLAVLVNLVELLCTAGLPAIYTAVLSQQNLEPVAHYGYLGLYILGYIADDALMVVLAVWALSSDRLSERGGRILKFISGGVMAVLALVLLLRPGWLF
ncbi:MAG: glutaredoxin domain-containing protein [Synechococcaceae cyanobacterium]